ncbi:hypothetical protein Tco_1005084 [Tanacetum coccineum]|uniref:Uncharacterized protein n=1 Tax=Tanacetum coccineum TaxID=301880 RepID=A0ABQ5FDQ2_9ASTR
MRTHPTNYRASFQALRSCGPRSSLGLKLQLVTVWWKNIEFWALFLQIPAKSQVEMCNMYVANGTVRTARISIPPIEPNLAERARISAINLDDYQFDPLSPHIPPPSSPFTMVLYQRMIAEMDPTQREEASKRKLDVKPRVEEHSLETLSVDELITQRRQMCEDAEDRASNAQEEA